MKFSKMDMPKKDHYIIIVVGFALLAMGLLYFYYDRQTSAIEEQIKQRRSG